MLARTADPCSSGFTETTEKTERVSETTLEDQEEVMYANCL